MASRTSRTSVVRGRPPGYTGMSGSTKAHCSSVTSLGYLWLRIPTAYENRPLMGQSLRWPGAEACVMQNAEALQDIYRPRGANGLPLERVYRHLFDPELFLRAYGTIYRNAGAMTKGATEETVGGMDLLKIHKIIALLEAERYEWNPARRVMIPKANGKMRPLGI